MKNKTTKKKYIYIVVVLFIYFKIKVEGTVFPDPLLRHQYG